MPEFGSTSSRQVDRVLTEHVKSSKEQFDSVLEKLGNLQFKHTVITDRTKSCQKRFWIAFCALSVTICSTVITTYGYSFQF